MDSHAALSHEEICLLSDQASSDVESEGAAGDVERWLGLAQPKISKMSALAAISRDYLVLAPWRILVRMLVFLTPSFLQGPEARKQICPEQLSPTAYIDGIRGLAALFVYFCHYSYQGFVIAQGWGYGDDNYYFLKLPFIRLWYQGPPAVCVFFVISGYALSYRPLKHARGRSFADFSTAVSSLVFRRGIRLFLPTAISTFMISCLLQIGAYEWTREFANDRTYMKVIVETHPFRMPSVYTQLRDWALQVYNFIHVFGWERFGGSTYYDVHLWTIPVEFRCSLYLFLVLIGTARLQTRLRFLFMGPILWFTYRNSRWDLFLFFCGMLLAEWDHIRGAHVSSPALPLEEKQPHPSRPLKRIFWILVSVLGLYLMCQPDDGGESTPGWRFLSSLIPKWWAEEKYRYWQSAGAVIFVLAAAYSNGWQRFFSHPVVQYFGRISYAIYLMHGPAMHTAGYHWEKWAYSLTGVEGHWYGVGFALGACFAVPTVIWWADVFWRAVDIPAVKFAKWFESKCIVKDC